MPGIGDIVGGVATVDVPTLIVAAVALMAPVVLYKLYVVLRSEPRGLLALTYNPTRRMWSVAELFEVSPGIYTDRSGKIIAFIPFNADTETLVVGGKRLQVVPLYRYSNVYSEIPTVDAIALGLSYEAFPKRISSFADLVTYLYQRKELPARMRLRPDMELYIYLNPAEAAKMLTMVYEKTAEESVSAIGAMTGQRQSFEQFVKTLIKLKEAEAEAVGGVILRIGLVLGVIVVVVFALLRFLGGGGGG